MNFSVNFWKKKTMSSCAVPWLRSRWKEMASTGPLRDREIGPFPAPFYTQYATKDNCLFLCFFVCPFGVNQYIKMQRNNTGNKKELLAVEIQPNRVTGSSKASGRAKTSAAEARAAECHSQGQLGQLLDQIFWVKTSTVWLWLAKNMEEFAEVISIPSFSWDFGAPLSGDQWWICFAVVVSKIEPRRFVRTVSRMCVVKQRFFFKKSVPHSWLISQEVGHGIHRLADTFTSDTKSQYQKKWGVQLSLLSPLSFQPMHPALPGWGVSLKEEERAGFNEDPQCKHQGFVFFVCMMVCQSFCSKGMVDKFS